MTSNKQFLVLLLLGTLSACVSRPPPPVVAPDPTAARRALEAGGHAYATGQYDQALQSLSRLAMSTDFASLSSADRVTVLKTAGLAAHASHDDRTSFEFFRRATEIPDAPVDTWLARAGAAERVKDAADTCLSVTTYLERSPESLARFKAETLSRLVYAAADLPVASGLELRFLRALYHAHWKLDDDFEPSFAWLKLVQRSLESGAKGEAADVTTHITASDALLAMRIDRRFDSIVSRNEAQFDIDAAADRELAQMQAVVERAPHVLKKTTELMDVLMRRGRYETALTLADSILEDRAAHREDPDYLKAMGEGYNWILDYRARALAGLGRWNEAVAQLEAASRLSEDGGGNVSQIINFAELCNDVGQAERAMLILDRLGSNRSQYGSAAAAMERLRAALQLDDTNQISESLRYLSDHRTDLPQAYQKALLAVGDLDGAAKLMIQRLADPERRRDALVTVQHYAQPPLTSVAAAERARLDSMISRRDVQAAIDKVGRIETFSITSPFG